MLITNQLERSPSGGRELLCRLNHDALRDIYGEQLAVMQLTKRPIRGFGRTANAFRGHLDGVDLGSIASALQVIREKGIGRIFVDGSNFGELVRAIKSEHPRTKVHTFFHNVEARFFWGSYRQSPTIHALGVAAANYFAERKATIYSDTIICLSERDSGLLRKVYGRAATHVSPMAMRDRRPTGHEGSRRQEDFALFVGGVFYANKQGMAWFAREVAPRIDTKTFVVGKGFDTFKEELELSKNVEVVGAVDCLADWYSRARFVIAPIFDGSGMKTKVAEAMMFGKKVIGTPEAFSGYEDVADRAGWTCSTADDFVAAIAEARARPLAPFDRELRALYEQKYSFPAARARLESILGSPSK